MNKGVILVILVLVVVGVLGFQTGAYLQFESLFSKTSAARNSGDQTAYFDVSTLFNYGNGTSIWSNETRVHQSWNFYNLTVFLAQGRVQSQFFGPPLNEYQVLGINGVEQDSTNYWSLWKFCPKSEAWAYSNVGAQALLLSNHSAFGWYYQNQNTQPPAPPVANAPTVSVLNMTSC